MRRRVAGDAGQATVELVLCLPFVVMLIVAMIEIAGIIGDHVQLWHAAREAVRVAAVDPEVDHVRYAAERATGMAPLDVSVQPRPELRRQGEPVRVSVSYRTQAAVPLLGDLLASRDLNAVASMRIEQP